MSKNYWKHKRCGCGACKMDRQNKKCSCARKSERKKNNAGTDKEEKKKLAGSLVKNKLPV